VLGGIDRLRAMDRADSVVVGSEKLNTLNANVATQNRYRYVRLGSISGTMGYPMNSVHGSSRLQAHRLLLRKAIDDYQNAPTDQQILIWMRIRMQQERLVTFRRSTADLNHSLAWVDSWRPANL